MNDTLANIIGLVFIANHIGCALALWMTPLVGAHRPNLLVVLVAPQAAILVAVWFELMERQR